ncbi:ribosomal protein S3 (mitochondrion) [Armillaria borealis]|uniref:Small ribosomal subunit protein uS3m n=1 Tax=Armillaria borealis TaxID=47425 RepID=A0A4D6FHJ0_9AGAR|nr:ribosomal protein S3 [Armillaria borealis]QCB16403.1 ribosomal protein S3 [Armillaria borealis]
MKNKNWSTKNQFAGYQATKPDQTPTNLGNNLFYEKKYNQFLNNNKNKEKFNYNYNNYLYKNVDIFKDKFKEIYSFWNFLDIFNLSIKNELISNSVKRVKTDGRIDSEKNTEKIEILNIIRNEEKIFFKINNGAIPPLRLAALPLNKPAHFLKGESVAHKFPQLNKKNTSNIKPNKEIYLKDKKTTINILLTSLNLKNHTLVLKNKYENYISSVYNFCSKNNLNKEKKLQLINKYNYLFVNYLNIFIKKVEKTSQYFTNLSYNKEKHSPKNFNYNYIENTINSKIVSTAYLNIPNSNSINLNSNVSNARLELNKNIFLQATVNKHASQKNKIILPLFSSPILKRMKYNYKQSVILISMAKLEKYSKLIKSYNLSLLAAQAADHVADGRAPLNLNLVIPTADLPNFKKGGGLQQNLKVGDLLIANNNLEFIWGIKKNVDFYKINLQFYNLKKKIINWKKIFNIFKIKNLIYYTIFNKNYKLNKFFLIPNKLLLAPLQLPLLLQNQKGPSNNSPNELSKSLEGIKYHLSLLLNKKIKNNKYLKINNKKFKHFLILFSKRNFKNKSLWNINFLGFSFNKDNIRKLIGIYYKFIYYKNNTNDNNNIIMNGNKNKLLATQKDSNIKLIKLNKLIKKIDFFIVQYNKIYINNNNNIKVNNLTNLEQPLPTKPIMLGTSINHNILLNLPIVNKLITKNNSVADRLEANPLQTLTPKRGGLFNPSSPNLANKFYYLNLYNYFNYFNYFWTQATLNSFRTTTVNKNNTKTPSISLLDTMKNNTNILNYNLNRWLNNYQLINSYNNKKSISLRNPAAIFKENKIKNEQTIISKFNNFKSFNSKLDSININSNPVNMFLNKYHNKYLNKPILNQFLKTLSFFNLDIKGTFIYFTRFVAYNFNYQNNILVKEIYDLLYLGFKSMNCLISKPVFTFKTDKIIINLFYYIIISSFFKKNKWNKNIFRLRQSNNFKSRYNRIRFYYSKNKFIKSKLLADIPLTRYELSKKKLNILCLILSKFFNKPVELNLVRVHYPYNDSNILVNLLGLVINKVKLLKVVQRLFNNAIFKDVLNYEFKSKSNKSDDLRILPTFLAGIKLKVAGRLMKEKVIPRKTTKKFSKGSSSIGKINFTDTSRFTSKNRRGAFSITISSSQNFFNKY